MIHDILQFLGDMAPYVGLFLLFLYGEIVFEIWWEGKHE